MLFKKLGLPHDFGVSQDPKVTVQNDPTALPASQSFDTSPSELFGPARGRSVVELALENFEGRIFHGDLSRWRRILLQNRAT
jgi:hypothetical protein